MILFAGVFATPLSRVILGFLQAVSGKPLATRIRSGGAARNQGLRLAIGHPSLRVAVCLQRAVPSELLLTADGPPLFGTPGLATCLKVPVTAKFISARVKQQRGLGGTRG